MRARSPYRRFPLPLPDLRLVAAHCIRRRTGARSLRTIVEEVCHDIMFDAPERRGETIIIEADAVAAHLARPGGTPA